MTTLLSLPLEVREKIFRYYFTLDGGYVFDGKSDKLTCPDGQPIDFSLMYTCRLIASDTKRMPLALNTITFSTFYRDEWRGLAGCFNYASTYYSLLQSDLVVCLSRFMTREMYSQLATRFPTFDRQLKKASKDNEQHLALPHSSDFWLDSSDDESERDLDDDGSEEESVDDGSPEDTSAYDGTPEDAAADDGYDGTHEFRHGRPRLAHDFWPYYHFQLEHSAEFFNGLGGVDNDCKGHLLRRHWTGGVWVIHEAMSYCLRLLAEKQPIEFGKLVYAALPGWVGKHPAQEFFDLAFEPWAIPSQSEVEIATSRLDADTTWKLLEPWYYAPSQVYTPLGNISISGKPKNIRCREKIRFSAAAAAIRFLGRLPPNQRVQIRNLILLEDLPSVSAPSSHAQGLAPFFKENPRLRVQRRVSVLGCIDGHLGSPGYAAHVWDEHKAAGTGYPKWLDSKDFTHKMEAWLLDALAVTDAGIPAESFTFVLDGGPDLGFCTDLFQQVIHRDIAWHKAHHARISRGLSYYPPHEEPMMDRDLVDLGFENAVAHLMNEASFVRCNFQPGVPWDVEKLVEETADLDTMHWAVKWVQREPQHLEWPPALDYTQMLAANFEIQTKEEFSPSRSCTGHGEPST